MYLNGNRVIEQYLERALHELYQKRMILKSTRLRWYSPSCAYDQKYWNHPTTRKGRNIKVTKKQMEKYATNKNLESLIYHKVINIRTYKQFAQWSL